MLFRFPHSSWLPACRRLLLLLPALALAAGLSARSLVKADVQLANNAVLAMYQDEDANMWIGTYDGLHLYNGKNTFVFRMELDNEFSLCSNIVLEIAPAEKGYLWVATSLGINKFSLRERRVVESYMQYVDVENIASDSEGNTVLFSGEDFITCYRPGRAFFEDVYIPGVRAAEIVTVWSEAPRVFCTLGRDGELVRYRLNDGEGKSLVRVSGRQLSARPVRKAFFNGGRLHFVDTSGGLWRYTYKDESLVLLSDLSQLGETGLYRVDGLFVRGRGLCGLPGRGPGPCSRERRPLRADRLGLPRFLPVGRLQPGYPLGRNRRLRGSYVLRQGGAVHDAAHGGHAAKGAQTRAGHPYRRQGKPVDRHQGRRRNPHPRL